MSFISKEYIIFFIIVFFLYYSLAKSFKIQNLLILLASYFFYGWFNWKLLGLMLFTTIVAYTCALYIPQSRINNDKYAKWILVIGVGILLGVLGVFKYYNFFVVSLSTLLTKAHIPFNLDTIKIILPIGISFYTFQAISYIVDVYKGKIQPEKNFIDFAAFKAFFPQLVAGPIERADHLLVQFKKSRTLTSLKVKQAIWLLTYGFFIKVVIADNAALIVNYAFIDNQQFGWWVILGTSAFTLQIYTDFLGYSLIAKGSALLLGFELIWNFHFPYWAVSIQDFWRRWHISLSSWLRDYLYIPLGGNQKGRNRTVINILITMLLGGLWHGANWTFVLWGAWHGLFLSVARFTPNLKRIISPRYGIIFRWFGTMIIVSLGWLLFRVQSFEQLITMLNCYHNMEWLPGHLTALKTIVVLSAPIFILEWFQLRRNNQYVVLKLNHWLVSAIMAILICLTLAMFSRSQPAFIYFQF